MKPILSIKNIKKDFYNEKTITNAIDNISFDLYEKDFLAIVGSSGCGKSTLLNIISELDYPTDGKTIKNDITIGYMLQEDALLNHLNILDNSLIGLKIQNKLTSENIKFVNKLLDTYGLKDFKEKYPYELSGGMKQRVALIRTLAINPDVILLDEPFSALDYQSRLKVSEDVYNIIKKENKTVIMITHDIAEAISLANRIIVFSKRPAHIKKEYEIKLSGDSPINNRNCPEFKDYYEKIWRDLD